jgi:hypothetical protein
MDCQLRIDWSSKEYTVIVCWLVVVVVTGSAKSMSEWLKLSAGETAVV